MFCGFTPMLFCVHSLVFNVYILSGSGSLSYHINGDGGLGVCQCSGGFLYVAKWISYVFLTGGLWVFYGGYVLGRVGLLVLGFYFHIVVLCSFVGFRWIHTLRERRPIFIHQRGLESGGGNAYVFCIFRIWCEVGISPRRVGGPFLLRL